MPTPAPDTPTTVTKILTNEDLTKQQRIKLALIEDYCLLHSGGGVNEPEKARNAYAWTEKLLPYIESDQPVT